MLMLSAAVVVGRLLGLWSTIPLVTGLYWFLISGIPLLMTSFTEDPVAYGKRLGEACGISAVFVAFISVSTFSLPEEVFIVLFAELLGILYAASLMSEDTGKRMRRLFPTVPMLFYLVIVLGSMLAGKVSVVNVLQAFLLPVILTGTLQPYIKYVRFMERYEGRGGPVSRRWVSSEDYGEDWPFTVGSVRLCHQASSIWVETRRLLPIPRVKRYAVNGLAKSWLTSMGCDCEDLEDIWKPTSHGSRVSIGPIIRDGFRMGEGSRSRQHEDSR